MYVFKPSTRKNKKYDVYKNDKYLVSFGSSLNQQYFDKIGYYSNLANKIQSLNVHLKYIRYTSKCPLTIGSKSLIGNPQI